MWLLTPRGFFSAVEKCGDKKDHMITVRARCKADLENLAEFLPDDVKPFREKGYTDYPWRIRLQHELWDEIVKELSREVNYSNFKDEVKTRNSARASVYGQVWGTLLRIENEDPTLPKVPSTLGGSYDSRANAYGTYGEFDDDPPASRLVKDLPGADGGGYGGSPAASSRSVTRSKGKRQGKLFKELDAGTRNKTGSAPRRKGR